MAYDGETSGQILDDKLFYVTQNLPYVTKKTSTDVHNSVVGDLPEIVKLIIDAATNRNTKTLASDVKSALARDETKINNIVKSVLVKLDNELKNQFEGTPSSNPAAVQRASNAAKTLISNLIKYVRNKINVAVQKDIKIAVDGETDIEKLIKASGKSRAEVLAAIQTIIAINYATVLKIIDVAGQESLTETNKVNREVSTAVKREIAPLY